MRTLPQRQVHLDFHTSEHIPGVGKQFDKHWFQQALKEGNLNSITVFAKCHHGWCYYPSDIDPQHPTMEPGFDLTGAMVDAAHEIGVAAPIYITLGWSVQDAQAHPEWRMIKKDGTPLYMNTDPDAAPDDPRPVCSWETLCPSGDYAQKVYALTREVVERYPVVDGLFYDIVYIGRECYCDNCRRGMIELGKDPDNEQDARAYYVQNHLNFMAECERILHEKHPEATLFFNSGGAEIYRPEYHAGQTHYEMEDLPTTWGGYDKMAPRASFMRRYPKQFLGMTGKFHTSWGEFGGYKNPDALKFEVAMMATYGAHCSVGDQMPPSGRMDMETYRLIGHAYRYVESIEPWCYDEESTTGLGVYLSGDEQSDQGLHSMLLEKQLDFEVVMPGDDLSRFEALVLPDCVELSAQEAKRIAEFAAGGKGVLLTGQSGLKGSIFLLDVGGEYQGAANTRFDYLQASEAGLAWVDAPFLCYESADRIAATDGQVLARIYEPWFDRTYAKYCSHMNTPYKDQPASHVGGLRKGSVVYLSHKLCAMYHRDGAQLFRDLLVNALKLVYTPKARIDLPSGGRNRLTLQKAQRRYVLHMGYAAPVQRGRTSVLEDMIPLHDVNAEIDLKESVSSVMLQPQNQSIDFSQNQGVLRFAVPEVRCHQVIEINLQ